MANKRDLKKVINNVCADIATECLIAAKYVKGVEPEKMDEIVGKLADLQAGALSSISFAFDKVPSEFENMREYNKAKSAYFRKAYNSLREKFSARIHEIVKEMNATLPAEVKDANKKSLADA